MGIDGRIHIQLAAPGQRISFQLQECFLNNFIALQGEAEQQMTCFFTCRIKKTREQLIPNLGRSIPIEHGWIEDPLVECRLCNSRSVDIVIAEQSIEVFIDLIPLPDRFNIRDDRFDHLLQFFTAHSLVSFPLILNSTAITDSFKTNRFSTVLALIRHLFSQHTHLYSFVHTLMITSHLKLIGFEKPPLFDFMCCLFTNANRWF
ncbi:hypothetical protein D3C73_710420 [compost metagenome]